MSEIRSASFGHSLGGAVGLVMLDTEEPISKHFIKDGEWEVDIGDSRCRCDVSLHPFYDPKGTRVRL